MRRAKIVATFGPATASYEKARAVIEAGLDVAPAWVVEGDFTFNSGALAMEKLHETSPDITAIFASNDDTALGVLQCAARLGLSVPGDIGLIGLNDMEMARWQLIGLTTIHQPVAQIIEAAIDLVVSIIETPDRPPEVRLFPCRVIERRTLRAL